MRNIRIGFQTFRCAIGRGGIGVKSREGNGVTPIGRFGVLPWFRRVGSVENGPRRLPTNSKRTAGATTRAPCIQSIGPPSIFAAGQEFFGARMRFMTWLGLSILTSCPHYGARQRHLPPHLASRTSPDRGMHWACRGRFEENSVPARSRRQIIDRRYFRPPRAENCRADADVSAPRNRQFEIAAHAHRQLFQAELPGRCRKAKYGEAG